MTRPGHPSSFTSLIRRTSLGPGLTLIFRGHRKNCLWRPFDRHTTNQRNKNNNQSSIYSKHSVSAVQKELAKTRWSSAVSNPAAILVGLSRNAWTPTWLAPSGNGCEWEDFISFHEVKVYERPSCASTNKAESVFSHCSSRLKHDEHQCFEMTTTWENTNLSLYLRPPTFENI